MDSSKNCGLIKQSAADSQIKTLLKSNKNSAWNAIYDKYAAVMYGNILNITKDKALAEKIFVAAFRSIKDEDKDISVLCSIQLYLCAYGKKITLEYMNANNNKL